MSTPETTTIAINFDDRLARRVILILNNDRRCVVGTYVEDNPAIPYDETLDNTQLYELLSKRGK